MSKLMSFENSWHAAFWREATDCIFIVRLTDDGGFAYEAINPALESLSGLTSDQVAYRSPAELLLPDEAEATVEHYRDCYTQGRSIRYEHSLTLPTGVHRFDTCLSPLRNPKTGKIDRLLGSCRDVTERDTTIKALENSEATFRVLAQTLPGMIFIVSADGHIEYANPQFYEYTGAEGDVPIAGSYLSYVHPEDLSSVITLRRRVSLTDQPFEAECRLRAANGSYHWFLVRSRSLVQNDQRRWFGIATNIDTVKEYAANLGRSNRQLENILSGISDCYFTIDRNWNCIHINDRARAWFKASPSDTPGSRVKRFCEANPLLLDAVRDALERGQSFRQELQSLLFPDRWISIYVCGIPEGASVFFHDITDRKKSHQQIEQARELLQSSLDAVPARIAILDSRGDVFSINRAWRHSAGSPRQIGQSFPEICDSADIRHGYRRILSGATDTFQLTYSASSEGETVWYRCSILRFGSGDKSWMIVIYDDVTQVVRAEQKATDLAAKLLTLQEEERQQIAGDLHDSTSHHLVAASLSMMRIRALEKDAPELDSLYGDIEELIDEALKEIRTFTYLLYPRNLDSDKLKRTVERFVEGLHNRAPLRITTEIDEDVDALPLPLQRTIVRVVQEALSNIHRHADATEAKIVLKLADTRLLLTISDNGRGIEDTSTIEATSSFGVGIPGMRARLSQYDGILNINGSMKGTAIMAEIPVMAINFVEKPLSADRPAAAFRGSAE